ncbi:MAG: prepilin-type N-terminal cleavage/methylation domain-containing protein [Elusimicrobia bacterium]|nr:prepilin-type N-terminal cleavage/methylation domain-containing protein [Elusimicrobiota bacterium]
MILLKNLGNLFNNQRNCFSKGFTLVESMVMLALIGFLTAVLLISMTNLFSYRAKAAARLLVSDLVYAKKTAETTQVKSGVIFYPAQDKYVVYTSTFTTPITDPVNRKSMIRDFTKGELRNVNIVSAAFPAGTEYIEFDPLGRNLSGGKTVLQYGSDSYSVWVEDNTGRAYWTSP